MSISALSIGAVVGVCISAAVIMLFLAIPLFYLPVNLPTGAALASIGLVGVFAGSMIIWSDRRGGRWRWVGLALSLEAVVGASISGAISVLFVAAPLTYRTVDLPTGAALASIGLVGVAAGSMIIWSDRHKGRWGWVGLALSLLYLGASLAPPIFLVTAHWYGPVALALVLLAVWNILWNVLRRRREGSAG